MDAKPHLCLMTQSFSCFDLVFEMNKNALLVATSVIQIAECQAFKVSIYLRLCYAGVSCIW